MLWRELPPDYGDWKNINRRFCRWRDNVIKADCLIADRGYDTDKIITEAGRAGEKIKKSST